MMYAASPNLPRAEVDDLAAGYFKGSFGAEMPF
jgi:hypothetical protein